MVLGRRSPGLLKVLAPMLDTVRHFDERLGPTTFFFDRLCRFSNTQTETTIQYATVITTIMTAKLSFIAKSIYG